MLKEKIIHIYKSYIFLNNEKNKIFYYTKIQKKKKEKISHIPLSMIYFFLRNNKKSIYGNVKKETFKIIIKQIIEELSELSSFYFIFLKSFFFLIWKTDTSNLVNLLYIEC